MPFSTFCSRAVIVLINLLFWGLSAGLVFLGVWILTMYANYEQLSDVLNFSLLPAYILLAAGFVLFALGTIGCVGAVRDHKCLYGLYFSLLLIAFIGVVAGVALAGIFHGKITSSLRAVMDDSLHKYDNDTGCQKAVDFMQSRLHCCGVYNYSDWLDTEWHSAHPTESYPPSCCVNNSCNYTYAEYDSAANIDPHLYLEGCYGRIRSQFLGHINVVYGIVGACLLVMLFGLISACVLMRTRHMDSFIYRDMSDTDGMHV